ncbi:hypothetical protein [Nocardia altamirensis]|uniref:hypothetical protein n=1 Tax=Nocardia altamirensis TaxID=472158 RepID=UPI00114D1D90|nr:hypothetical protein [Nocardia altamirensis]
MLRSSRAAVTTVATLSALAAAIAVAAPQAAADVSVRVNAGQSFGSSGGAIGTGCAYPITVYSEPGKELFLVDMIGDDQRSAKWETFRPYRVVTDASGTAYSTWTPNRRGPLKIVVLEASADDEDAFDAWVPRNTTNVGTGINLGPACAVLP